MSLFVYLSSSFVLLLTLAVLHTCLVNVGGNITYEVFKVNSTIVSRYASTSFTSTILNAADTSQELSFQVQLPDTAFISDFIMIVNGTTYAGVVDEKQKAADEFDRRKKEGQNVGLVESRGTNLFLIRINAAASSRSTFVLTYEELLIRRLSSYRQIINLNPGSRVNDLSVAVRVVDDQGIRNFKTSDFATARRVSDKEVQYTYSATVLDQDGDTFGLSRDLLVEFDVIHPTGNGAGSVIINDCYFAQFFSPPDVSTIPVDIVFVIDTSGSMSGTKISQARESLVEVISQLRDEDRYTIIRFSSTASAWKDTLVSVMEYRNSGKEFAENLEANGGTFFSGGMEKGIGILKQSGYDNYVQLLVMLTDGEPTVGITDPDEIVDLAQKLLKGTRISLNTLGFGARLDYLLLQRLAIGNKGIAKKIFEGQDAAQQLEGFYEEISSPILRSVIFSYTVDVIEDISDVEFPLLFQGSEIVVAGKFVDDVCVSGSSPVTLVVRGMGSTAELMFQSQVDPTMQTEVAGVRPSTERLAAYLTVKQLLNTLKVTKDDDLASTTRQALDLSLRYNFVTELTSLIVVEESSRDNISVGDFGIEGGLEEEDFQGNQGSVKFAAKPYDIAVIPAAISPPVSTTVSAPTSASVSDADSFVIGASTTATSSVSFVIGLTLAAVFLTVGMDTIIITTAVVCVLKIRREQSCYRVETVNKRAHLTVPLEGKQKEEGHDHRSMEEYDKDEKNRGET